MLQDGSNKGVKSYPGLSPFAGGRALLIGLCLVAALPVDAARRDRAPAGLSHWHQGPVRYLMNGTETRLFKKLKTDAERITFIKRFWDRRDPLPATPQNELRVAFWQRVVDANRKFNDTPRPGWKTDRGKIYILLGPPFDMQSNQEFDTGKQTVSARGLMRWFYRGLQQASNRAEFIIAFYRDSDGDWKLSDDPKLASPYLDISSHRVAQQGPVTSLTRFADLLPGANAGTMATAMDLGRLQEVPTESELLRTAVKAEQFVGNYTATARWHDLGPAVAGAPSRMALTMAVLSKELVPVWDGSALSLSARLSASAQLKAVDRAGVTIDIDESSFQLEPAPSPDDDWIRLQAIVELPPGRYDWNAVALDRLGDAAGATSGSLTVTAPPTQGPLIIGPILAARIAPNDEPGREPPQPFRLSTITVTPLMETTLRTKQPLALALAISGAPGNNDPVALDWVVTHTSPNGTPTTFGAGPRHLDDGRGPRAWEFPAGTLPIGSYRIELRATQSGALLQRTVEFTVR